MRAVAQMSFRSLFFDQQDRELLLMANKVIERQYTSPMVRKLFDGNLHPHGIKELSVSRELRIAYAVINLLDTLEAGRAEDRLMALTALRDEALMSAETGLRRNTARVLIQIMKELVRAHGDQCRQLKLAHDFRRAASGKPRVIRALLRRYHLLEMPEAWNQLAFDNHVHDANTKGRKNPTHLIMDAWIKGIRHLTVIYYNYIEPAAAQELLQAAEIMGVSIRIGVEFKSPLRGKYVDLIWVPRGFSDAQGFLAFLAEAPTQHLMHEGRKASRWQEQYVLRMLQRWNNRHRRTLNTELGLTLEPLGREEFLAFVGTGQASLLHLAEFIHKRMKPALESRVEELRDEWRIATPPRRTEIETRVEQLNRLDPETILDTWLTHVANDDLPDPEVPSEAPELPDILRMDPRSLLDWLTSLHSGYRVTLNLGGVTVEDVLELLWDCEGLITHLELFNLKDWHEGKADGLEAINALQLAINSGRVPLLKQLIRNIIKDYTESGTADCKERCDKFRAVLRNIPRLQGFYKSVPLRSRIGTDSTSRSHRMHGMGLVFPETLPPRAQRVIRDPKDTMRQIIPVRTTVFLRESYQPRRHPPLGRRLTAMLRRIPGLSRLGYRRETEWVVRTDSSRVTADGNIATLGGFLRDNDNDLSLKETAGAACPRWMGFGYMNTGIVNLLKVLAGFIPAMLSFQYTQSWWVLAWFGALIWFGITGFRNILQAVLGGGGISRTPLLRWNDYVSWSRISDSLMYTGISVPLLEVVMRSLVLQDMLGLTVQSNPTLVYTCIAVANGLYIAAHNSYRGLQREAIIGNLFRSALAIPMSMLYNEIALELLVLGGVADPWAMIQPGAAVISKTASDTVAAIIEGFADRNSNLRMRRWDYESKLEQLYDSYARLELLFPEEDVLELLKAPKQFIRAVEAEARHLETAIIINALDLMYFWMYQPRARDILREQLRSMSADERKVLVRSQLVLTREREVSQLFVDGIVGRNFSRPLAFYLDRHEEYLRDMEQICARGSAGC
ncbi:MAG TPA: hypothetical protein DEF41_08815 [Desulfovibrio sp.]|uniref:Uncharacterized protein n=2 Tax=Nitratidesulfovibrio vulgaris TaxID=881 RepID=A0A0H3A5I6_NITV4|nr:conserved hypothetical protein [Nitratidesulfovibrio vulgaris DP4]GEB79649.1 hypothetical protein DDE01_10640 [Desulfovibrio desulfuricans]HBW16216.1 hypothetical protein [Desulfovibrio sp.]